MGVMTISLPQEVEADLRGLAKEEYGQKKGAIQQALVDAIAALKEKVQAKRIAKRQMALMRKGFHMGKFNLTREEIYERD